MQVAREKIKNWWLKRETPNIHLSESKFIQPYISTCNIGNWSEWKHLQVEDEVCTYSVSVDHKAYITHNVQMDNLPITKRMKYRDLIIDNYRDAGGDPKTLETIGTEFIVEGEALDAIRKVFKLAGKPFKPPATIEVYPPFGQDGSEIAKALMERNPFAQGAVKMVEERAGDLGNPTISKMVVIIEGEELRTNEEFEFCYEVHMVVVLKRG